MDESNRITITVCGDGGCGTSISTSAQMVGGICEVERTVGRSLMRVDRKELNHAAVSEKSVDA